MPTSKIKAEAAPVAAPAKPEAVNELTGGVWELLEGGPADEQQKAAS